MKRMLTLLTAAVLMFGYSSCVIYTPAPKKNPGKKKGWYKNRHNPHHPNSDNPGQGKHKHKLLELNFH